MSAATPMEQIWKGEKFHLYYARPHRGFVKAGVYLWTGKRHVRVVPMPWGNGR